MRTVLPLLLMLTACAGNDYVSSVPNAPEGHDLFACKKQTTDAFFAQHGNDAGLVGAGFGGVIGGMVGGVLTASKIDAAAMQHQVDDCMASKGYSRP